MCYDQLRALTVHGHGPLATVQNDPEVDTGMALQYIMCLSHIFVCDALCHRFRGLGFMFSLQLITALFCVGGRGWVTWQFCQEVRSIVVAGA